MENMAGRDLKTLFSTYYWPKGGSDFFNQKSLAIKHNGLGTFFSSFPKFARSERDVMGALHSPYLLFKMHTATTLRDRRGCGSPALLFVSPERLWTRVFKHTLSLPLALKVIVQNFINRKCKKASKATNITSWQQSQTGKKINLCTERLQRTHNEASSVYSQSDPASRCWIWRHMRKYSSEKKTEVVPRK